MKEVDECLPECPDVEEKWEAIAKAYIPDGIKEFNDYPTASLGWMMYIGMAVAKYWDAEWEMIYYGEHSFQMKYKDTIGEPFNWLYIDADTLKEKARRSGYTVEVVAEGEHYDYLARITKIQTEL